MELISAFFTFGSLWCGAGLLASMKVSDNQAKIEKIRLEQLKEQRRIAEIENPAVSRWVSGIVEPTDGEHFRIELARVTQQLREAQEANYRISSENERLKQLQEKFSSDLSDCRQALKTGHLWSAEDVLDCRVLNKKGE